MEGFWEIVLVKMNFEKIKDAIGRVNKYCHMYLISPSSLVNCHGMICEKFVFTTKSMNAFSKRN